MVAVTRNNTVHVYRDDVGEFRWRLKAGNGEEIGKSEEGYSDRSYARQVAVERNPDAVLVDDSPQTD